MSRSIALLAALSLSASGFVAAPAAAQGLLDNLFGGFFRMQPAPQPRYYEPNVDERRYYEPGRGDSSDPRLAPEGEFMPGDQALRPRDSVKPPPYVAPEIMPGPLGRFLRDPTLRRGDVVATPVGLMIFRGYGGDQHLPEDFVPLARARELGAHKPQLAAIERLMERDGRSNAATQ